MDEEEKKMVEIASYWYFVSIFYAPWFLKSYLSQANDLKAIKTSFTISQSYWNLGQSFILQATICLASDTGASLVFNSRWWHLRLGEEEDTLQNYEKIGPASYLALQNSVILLDLKAGYC